MKTKRIPDGKPLIGDEQEIRTTAPGNVPVRIVRDSQGAPWRIEGAIQLPKRNSFPHLRDARAYLRSLRKGADE